MHENQPIRKKTVTTLTADMPQYFTEHWTSHVLLTHAHLNNQSMYGELRILSCDESSALVPRKVDGGSDRNRPLQVATSIPTAVMYPRDNNCR